MDWDVRHWSLFIFLIAGIMLIMATSTPYYIKDEPIHFGSQGLWRVTAPEDGSSTQYFTVTAALLIVSLVILLLAFISYILLLRMTSTIVQIVTIVLQWLSAIFVFAGVGVFAANDTHQETGFWLAATSAGLLVFNGIILIFMPFMEYVPPKRYSDDILLKGQQGL